MQAKLKLIECPRDAMQGIQKFIPTELKIKYLNALLQVGFDSIDFGSFVSPKAVPQLADTAKIVDQLEISKTSGKLLAIIANQRGAQDACEFEQINYLGYPFSISETFQLRNTKKTIADSLELVKAIQELAVRKNKELVIYISMGFGNPYGDSWSPEIAEKWVSEMVDLGIKTISLADTVGTAEAESISYLFKQLIPKFPEVEFGAHLHASPEKRKLKLEAAWNSGCRRFDSAISGFGGCPFAEDELVGNIATESVLEMLEAKGLDSGLDKAAFITAAKISEEVFSYH